MNSEERPATGQTAYRRTTNILCLPALSNQILHVFGAVDPSLISSLLSQNNGASLDGKLRFPAVCEKLAAEFHGSCVRQFRREQGLLRRRCPV